MEIIFLPLKMMGEIFIPFPFLAIAPALLFAALFYAKKKPFLLVTSFFWAAYLAYESLMKFKILCSGECNIRVDLLLIYPILVIVTLLASYIARPSKIDDSAIAANELEPIHPKGFIVGLWIVAIYLVLSSGIKLFSSLFFFSAVVSASKPTIIFSMVLLILNISAGILLVFYKKLAFYILALAVTLHFSSFAYNYFTFLASAPGISLSKFIFPNVLLLAVLLFVFVLYIKRILWR